MLALLVGGCGAVDRARGLLGINEAEGDEAPAQAEPPTEAGPDAAPEPDAAPKTDTRSKGSLLASAIDSVSEVVDAPRAAEPEAKPEGPVAFAELKLEPTSSPVGAGKRIQLTAKASLQRLVSSDASIHTKLRCRHDGEVYASNGQIMFHFGEEQEVGKELELSSELAAPATPSVREPCELDMQLDGLTKKSLGSWCWTGTELAEGTCAEPVVAALPSGGSGVLEVVSVETSARSGSSLLGLDFTVRVLDPKRFGGGPYGSATLMTKAACDHGGLKVVTRGGAPLPYGKLALELGELALSGTELAVEPAAGAVRRCDVDVRVESYGPMGPEKDIVRRVCVEGTTVTDGRCDGKTVPVTSAVRATSSNVELHELEFTTSGMGDHQVLSAEAMLGVSEMIGMRSSLHVQTRCRGTGGMFDGQLYLSGDADLGDLLPGESTKLMGSTYFPTPDPLRWCELKVSIDDMSGTQSALQTLCMRGGTTKRGKC